MTVHDRPPPGSWPGSDDSSPSLDRIVVGRPFLEETRPPAPHLGHRVTIPRRELPDGPPPEELEGLEELADALGWSRPLPPSVDPARLEPDGLVEPDPWERSYLRWLAGEVGAALPEGWDRPSPPEEAPEAFRAVAERLDGSTPWEDPTEVPADVLVRRAATRRGEVLAFGRTLRDRLHRDRLLGTEEAARACEEVLVLLPDDLARIELWVRELERLDLPVRAPVVRSVGRSALGAWIRAVAELAGWSETARRSRVLLRRVLDSPFFSPELEGDDDLPWRSAARQSLRELRRPTVSLGEWTGHLAHAREAAEEKGWSDRARALDRLSRWSRTLADALRPGDRLVRRLARLLHPDHFGGTSFLELGRSVRVRESGKGTDEASPSSPGVLLAGIRSALADLVREEAAHGGVHPDLGDWRPASAERPLADLVSGALEGVHLRRLREPARGISLVPYSLYDGRPADHLVLAGLGEGGFPRVPARPTPDETAWLRVLGFEAPEGTDDPGAAWVRAELERQVRLARRAILGAREGITLSFAREGGGSEEVHPGPLLSLLVGSWTEEMGRGDHDRVEHVTWSDEFPAKTSEARSRTDARVFAARSSTAEAIRRHRARDDGGLDEESREFLHDLEETAEDLEPSLRADRERRPAPGDETGAPGPRAGRLPGRVRPAGPHSATTLAHFGQCPSKYLFGKVLGLDAEEDAPESLDPLEMGTLVHRVLAAVAQRETAPEEGQLLRLGYDERDPGDEVRRLRSLREKVAAEVDRIFAGPLRDHPTLSRPLLERIARRWKEAIGVWLEGHLAGELELDLSDEYVDGDPEVQAALADLREEEAIVLPVLEAVRSEVEQGMHGTTIIRWKERVADEHRLVSQRSAGDACRAYEDTGNLQAAIESWEEDLLGSAREDVEEAREKARRRIEDRLARRIAHSELAFGKDPDRREGLDDHSRREPVAIRTPQGEVPLKGTIDRVDWDPDRHKLVLRDYKSGRSFSSGTFGERLREGRKLQLLLYGLALEALVEDGTLEHLGPEDEIVEVAYEFPKNGKQAPLPPEGIGALGPDGEELTWREVARLWFGHQHRAIEEGRFDLTPVGCPIETRGEYCDFERICGYDPTRRREAADRDRPELHSPEEGEPSESERVELLVIPPVPGDGDLDPERARERHRRAGDAALELDRPVVLSAGAGTGKTHHLVLRYLRALTEARPREILCITFTRKAAAEMKHRVRQALLGGDPHLARHVPDALRGSPDRLREVILELSAAPIRTIDALAGRILSEARTFRKAAGRPVLGPPTEVSVGQAEVIGDVLDRFFTDRFLEALEDPTSPVARLAEEITVDRLRKKLREAVLAGPPGGEGWELGEDRKAAIRDLWTDLLPRPLLEEFTEEMQGWDLDEWERLLEEAPDREVTPKARTAHRAILRRLRAFQSEGLDDPWAAWKLVFAVERMPSTQREIGGKELYDYGRDTFNDLASSITTSRTPARHLMNGWEKVTPEKLDRWAGIAADVTRLVDEWSEAARRHLEARGVLRFADVLRLAREALEDEAIREELLGRFPFEHVLVDEGQDTNEAQVAFIRTLAGQTDATLFWVGDPKQSIFRWRDAEVDVFEKLVREAEDSGGRLVINFRSHPSLIRAFNRLFGGLLPAEGSDGSLDPGSRIAYEPLTWPEDRMADGEPRIDLVAAPAGTRWALEEDEPGEGPGDEGEGEENQEEVEDEVEGRVITAPEKATVQRIREVVDDLEAGRIERGTAPFPVAVLVHAWNRARRYRKLLALAGVPAVVQGGKGLLSTPEVDGLVLWLEMAVRRDRVATVGVLRGPGLGLSDAALACLRRGWGVEPTEGAREYLGEPPHRVDRAARFARLDPEAAVEAWQSASLDLDEETTRDLLETDARILERFRDLRDRFTGWLRRHPVADSLERLIDRLGLRAYWAARDPDRQDLANLERFLDLLRDLEGRTTSDPRELLRALDRLREGEDPASGGLGATEGADVVITTFWQAKGREWPVVILPDLERTKAERGSKGLGHERVVLKEALTGRPPEVRHVPEVLVTPEEKPFGTDDTPVRQLLDYYRGPAERAEYRRLLYVAMTRAAERLVLVGAFAVPAKGKRRREAETDDGETVRAFSLDTAKAWTEMLLACTDLAFDPDGTLRLGEEGCWEAGRDVTLHRARELADRLDEDGYPRATRDEPESSTEVDLDLDRWAPVASPRVRWVHPSDPEKVEVPPPIGPLAWPAAPLAPETPFPTEAAEGTAFHALVDRWAFASDWPDEALVRDALQDLGLLSPAGPDGRVGALLDLVERLRTGPEDLRTTLRRAAEENRLHTEVPVRYRGEGETWVDGTIDLLWRDGDGWHVLDFKVGRHHPTGPDPLADADLRKHHAQARLYGQGIEAALGPGELATYGIWYVVPKLAVRWPSDALES